MMNGKYIILKKNNKILSLLFHENRLLRVNAEEEAGNLLGNIYIAKVKNVTKNIDAAFVEIKPGCTCFLSTDEVRSPFMINRIYDGRILAGDEIAVQVYKAAVKTKPPAVTANLSLDGKYCVVSSGRPGIAYSAKLSAKAKQRIGEAVEDLFSNEKNGIIIRTNAKELTGDYAPLTNEINQLSAQLSEIMKFAVHRTCYSVLFEKPPGYLTQLRDMYKGQYEEIVTDDEDIHKQITAYASENPEFSLPGVRLYLDEMLPLYKLYSVETRLKEATDKKVWLKSGGYLIIEPTEALTVIDVNSGKVTAKKDNEEASFNINMEAAGEIALQLAVRNLSGIIIVDFISMKREEHNNSLMAYLGDLLKKDSVKTKLVDMTALGLVEITRMKISKPLTEQLSNAET